MPPLDRASPSPCPMCGSSRGVVHVHGHAQCLTCNTNIEPCCTGDNGNDAGSQSACRTANAADQAGPNLFPMVFDALGGRDQTVTTAALLFGLTSRLSCDHQDARLLLEAAERIGIVRTAPPGCHRLQLQDVATSPVDPPGNSL